MVFVGSLKASAHGYVSSPISRVKNSEANGFGWEAGLDSSQPSIISTPQGIEAPTKLLDSGKINGKLSSGGRPDYSKLDEQTETRWVKTAINSGENDFTWTITAEHKTNRFRYYMTKQGWNPNTPLSLDNMELIGVVGQPIGKDLPSGLGFPVGKQESHKITIPSDRKGYHVIYSVWDINDTVNSFYQSIDVIVK
ncbi:lytic polysaccharide monooxygenase [Enterococcus faecalis]|uniref:lytic polysaccharide monooxygenase n=1 Tax=Enterococcus faecalis TaxID=1351 RepID=UPI0025B0D4EF|nr:lytic polysaccharide monooxygenase [Enterococcus faecalis]MDN3185231.1 lytic polysaccharide monooxygenase [Enterococcus faecalis]